MYLESTYAISFQRAKCQLFSIRLEGYGFQGGGRYLEAVMRKQDDGGGGGK